MTTKKTKISKVDNIVKDGVKEVSKVKKTKKDTKKTKNVKISNERMHALHLKLAREYKNYIYNCNKEQLRDIIKLHFSYKEDSIKTLYDSKSRDYLLIIALNCENLYLENETFLKYLKSKEYKEKQDKNIAKKEDNKVASNIKDNSKAKKSFNKAIAKEVVKDNKK